MSNENLSNFIEPQDFSDDLFDDNGFGSQQEYVITRSVSAKDIIKLILFFLLVLVCALITAWMVYNIVTTGSAFPADIFSFSGDMIKDVKDFNYAFRS